MLLKNLICACINILVLFHYVYLCLTANLSSTYSYLYAQAAVSLIFKGTKRRTKEELQKLLFEDCIEVSSMQSYTVQLNLNLRVNHV